MRRPWASGWACCLAGLLVVMPAKAADPHIVRLASLEWPPHAGPALPQEGTTIARVRSAFASQGYRLEVEFLPWARALRAAEAGDHGVVGLLPEYQSHKSASRWWLSAPVGESPLGFVERSDQPVNWRQLEDLIGFRIGVVRGYINEARFDALASRGVLTVEEAPDDLANLRKVASGRLDLAVVDAAVLAHLVATQPALREARVPLQFNARILGTKTLHVAFRRDDEGRRAWAVLQRGLGHADTAAPPP
ncbi:substrate-binding periplasmic protein [Silanimonas algicola]